MLRPETLNRMKFLIENYPLWNASYLTPKFNCGVRTSQINIYFFPDLSWQKKCILIINVESIFR
jgi:hypothetical protein